MAKKEVYGGHDNEFVDEVSDRLVCQICTRVLRDPHLAVCCGQHFCESCLNKWFDKQRGKQSCPHCRAEGDAFNHVVHKSLRSEVNQLKVKCSNRGEGCNWTGELGTLKTHLESDGGCGFVEVECPNRCEKMLEICTMKRKELNEHLTHICYLRPYQCAFCGHKDTFEVITGHRSLDMPDDYHGHQAECPEAPLSCPNDCGSKIFKRKNIYSHRSKCPEEPVECPFAEAGCKSDIRRHQLEDHMTSGMQQHLMMVMEDYKVTKSMLEAKLQETEAKLQETEAKLQETEAKGQETEAKLCM